MEGGKKNFSIAFQDRGLNFFVENIFSNEQLVNNLYYKRHKRILFKKNFRNSNCFSFLFWKSLMFKPIFCKCIQTAFVRNRLNLNNLNSYINGESKC